MQERIEVEFEGKKLEGILITQDDTNYVIKLKSGYNATIAKDKTQVKKREENVNLGKEGKVSISKSPTPNQGKVLILHTGGTIASKVDYRTGAVTSKFTPEELLELYPDLLEIAQLDAKLVFNISSEDLRFKDYNNLLSEIENAIKENYDGVIISHGTDTLHYSAAALQYALENLSIPVLLVGAQRSSDRAGSDAYTNLKAAIEMILFQKKLDKKFLRVGACMHEESGDGTIIVLDGLSMKKMHSTRRDAFKQINYSPAARITQEGVEIVRDELFTLTPTQNLEITFYKEDLKMGFFKVHPNILSFELDLLENYDCVIMEGTGVGNIALHEDPTQEDGTILKKLSELTQKIPVIAAVQTVYGEVSLDIYSAGRDIQNAGVIGNRINLCSETLFMRAAHILSSKENDIKKKWNENLEGFEMRSEDI